MFVRGTLRESAQRVAASASKSGALISLISKESSMKEGDLTIQLRVLDLEKKGKTANGEKKEKRNPFLNPESELIVCDMTPTHLSILNKFAVLKEHALMITKEYVPQTTPLSLDDFTAIHLALQESNYLIFFNAGTVAGASQKHKHIQYLPLPLLSHTVDGEILDTPISSCFTNTLDTSRFEGLGSLPLFDFVHGVSLLPDYNVDLSSEHLVKKYASRDYDIYCDIFQKLGNLLPHSESAEGEYNGPYNFLMTRKWMMLVPRKEEFWNGISVNSLGFVGAILTQTVEQRKTVEEFGFTAFLSQLTFMPNDLRK